MRIEHCFAVAYDEYFARIGLHASASKSGKKYPQKYHQPIVTQEPESPLDLRASSAVLSIGSQERNQFGLHYVTVNHPYPRLADCNQIALIRPVYVFRIPTLPRPACAPRRQSTGPLACLRTLGPADHRGHLVLLRG